MLLVGVRQAEQRSKRAAGCVKWFWVLRTCVLSEASVTWASPQAAAPALMASLTKAARQQA